MTNHSTQRLGHFTYQFQTLPHSHRARSVHPCTRLSASWPQQQIEKHQTRVAILSAHNIRVDKSRRTAELIQEKISCLGYDSLHVMHPQTKPGHERALHTPFFVLAMIGKPASSSFPVQYLCPWWIIANSFHCSAPLHTCCFCPCECTHVCMYMCIQAVRACGKENPRSDPAALVSTTPPMVWGVMDIHSYTYVHTYRIYSVNWGM